MDLNNKLDFKQWCFDQHERVNHLYGELPYSFHLNAVEVVHQQFKHEEPGNVSSLDLSKACWGHDLEEDTRLTYNDIKEVFGPQVAEMIHALTNSKGRTRGERANADYYLNIRKTPGASFVKMCDRIANVRFSQLTGSGMFQKYRKENPGFMESIGADEFPRMKQELEKLFS